MHETARAIAKRESERHVIKDAPPPDIRFFYAPNIGLRAALQGRVTGQYPRNVDEIVDVDENLQADVTIWNELIEFYAREKTLFAPDVKR